MTESQDQLPEVRYEDLSEAEKIRAIMESTGVDEITARFMRGIESGKIEGDDVEVGE